MIQWATTLVFSPVSVGFMFPVFVIFAVKIPLYVYVVKMKTGALPDAVFVGLADSLGICETRKREWCSHRGDE